MCTKQQKDYFTPTSKAIYVLSIRLKSSVSINSDYKSKATIRNITLILLPFLVSFNFIHHYLLIKLKKAWQAKCG